MLGIMFLTHADRLVGFFEPLAGNGYDETASKNNLAKLPDRLIVSYLSPEPVGSLLVKSDEPPFTLKANH